MSSRLNHKAHRLLDLLGLQSYEPRLDHACRTSESHEEVDDGLSHITVNALTGTCPCPTIRAKWLSDPRERIDRTSHPFATRLEGF